MTISFDSPSHRAAGSDLTIAISPMGLVELADEEFEVHGPRMTRYATHWAFYLGHHWSYRREPGEPQLTFNYTRAISDFITNFTFGRGVNFRSPKETEHIVPSLLERVWELDNSKDTVLWEMGNQGSVGGDVFAKVAYEEPWISGTDENGSPIPGVIQRYHPGRVRIIPLNSSYCLTPDTEVLTQRGWLSHTDLRVGDMALSLNPDTDEVVWTPVEAVNVFDWDGPMARWENERMSVVSTPDHRWVYEDGRGKRSIKTTADLHYSKHSGGRLVVGGGTPMAFSPIAKYDDDLVELVGWFVTEGHWHTQTRAPMFTQSESVNEEKAGRIDRLVKVYGGKAYRYEGKATQWYVPRLREELHGIVGDGKTLTPEFLASLTYAQGRLLYEVLLDGDGHRGEATTFAQSDRSRMDGFQMLAALLGLRTQARWRQRGIGQPCGEATVYGSRYASVTNLRRTEEHYTGQVWCPTTGTGTWVARRNGSVFTTGNCFPEFHPHDKQRLLRFKMKYRFWGTTPEGTRQVFTYTELLTDQYIEEYINDQLVDARPNPLGTIPIAFGPNIMVSGSPWGLSDIGDVIALNREYNEKATDVSDIVNYHAAPVTVMTGAKASQLERGAKKMWAGLPRDAQVFNLELAGGGVQAGLSYLEMLKKAMHELTGVPQGALGDVQPISNTSGVALAIQYQPMMQRYNHKKMTYGSIFQRINELAILTLALKEPLALQWSPDMNEELKDYQQPFLDINDPISFVTVIHWPPPLPVDKTVVLNELMVKMQLGIVSKKDALEELGEVFPDEKLRETFLELVEDAINQGALDMLKSQISALVQAETGQFVPGAPQPFPAPVAGMPSGDPGVTSAGGPDVTSGATGGIAAPVMQLSADTQQLLTRLNTRAYGTTLAGRRTPPTDMDNTT